MCNKVEILIKDRGQRNLRGTCVTTIKRRAVAPEPELRAVRPRVVQLSAGRLKYSDLRMTALRGAFSEHEATAKDTEFVINNHRFRILSVTPGTQSWDFMVRRVET